MRGWSVRLGCERKVGELGEKKGGLEWMRELDDRVGYETGV